MLITRDNCLLVIVTYYPDKSFLDILSKLNEFNTLIIDNSDFSAKWLENACKDNPYSIYWHKDNIGIAAALNNAAQYAIKLGYKYIVSLDQDSTINSVILDSLIVKINVVPNPNLISTISPKHVSKNITIDDTNDEMSDDIFGLQSSNFINLDIWARLSGFNEDLFIDMVDTEYYIRSKIAGYSCITCNDITMIHEVGNNVKEVKIFGKYLRAFNHSYIRKYYQTRNFIYVYSKYRKLRPEAVYFMKIIMVMPLMILLFENDKLRKIKYMLKGIMDWYFNKMGKIEE